jgi:hypothetical protein
MSQCKRCSRDGLRWVQTDGKWRLYAGDTVHVCQWTKPPVRTPQKAQSAFTSGAAKWEAKQPPKEKFPPEADGDWQHLYWAFLDHTGMTKALKREADMGYKTQQNIVFEELVP